MSYAYELNGLDLDRWAILTPSTYFPNVSVKRTMVSVPGRDGEVVAGRPVNDSRTLTLTLLSGPQDLVGPDQVAADLSALLSEPSLTVRRISPEMTVEADAILTGHSWDGQSAPGTDTPVTVSLSLPGVFWRDPATVNRTLTAGTNVLDSTQVGSAPVTDAVVRFALGAANPSLTDAATGTGISVAYEATATEYVYVDVGAARAWKHTSDFQWSRSAIPSNWLDSALDYPGPGLLRIHPTLTGSGRQAQLTASHGAVVRYRKAWW